MSLEYRVGWLQSSLARSWHARLFASLAGLPVCCPVGLPSCRLAGWITRFRAGSSTAGPFPITLNLITPPAWVKREGPKPASPGRLDKADKNIATEHAAEWCGALRDSGGPRLGNCFAVLATGYPPSGPPAHDAIVVEVELRCDELPVILRMLALRSLLLLPAERSCSEPRSVMRMAHVQGIWQSLMLLFFA